MEPLRSPYADGERDEEVETRAREHEPFWWTLDGNRHPNAKARREAIRTVVRQGIKAHRARKRQRHVDRN